MRQILFKAKRKDNGEWVEGTVFYPESGITVMFPILSRTTEAEEVDPETVCQYTGKMDKNGKMIWENDFVRFSSRFDKELIWQGKVVYENFQFVVYELHNGLYDGYSAIPLSRVSMCNLEVIGNIHDEED